MKKLSHFIGKASVGLPIALRFSNGVIETFTTIERKHKGSTLCIATDSDGEQGVYSASETVERVETVASGPKPISNAKAIEIINDMPDMLARRTGESGELRVSYAGGTESEAYYTTDARDAVDTAKAMQAQANTPKRREPESKVQVGTVDCTPAWLDVVDIYAQAYATGSTAAQTELHRMAKLADKYNDIVKAMNAPIGHTEVLLQIAEIIGRL